MKQIKSQADKMLKELDYLIDLAHATKQYPSISTIQNYYAYIINNHRKFKKCNEKAKLRACKLHNSLGLPHITFCVLPDNSRIVFNSNIGKAFADNKNAIEFQNNSTPWQAYLVCQKITHLNRVHNFLSMQSLPEKDIERLVFFYMQSLKAFRKYPAELLKLVEQSQRNTLPTDTITWTFPDRSRLIYDIATPDLYWEKP